MGEIMLFQRVFIFSLLCLCIALSATFAGAQTLVSARILSSDGPVEIQRHAQGQATSEKISYRVNDELQAGDVIKTRKAGRLVLGLTDGSQAIISENTTVEIMDLSGSPRTIFNVLRGKTRVKIERVGGRPNPYRVQTPTTVIAVRGTLFDVLVSDKETQVFVHEGEVAVTNFRMPESPIILMPGERTRVQLSTPPEAPAHFQPGRNSDIFNPRQQRGAPSGNDARDGRGGGGRGPGEGAMRQPRDGDTQRQPNQPPQNMDRPANMQPREMPTQNAPRPQGRPLIEENGLIFGTDG